MHTPQPCVEALLIESGLSLPYAFPYKKPGFLPRTPLPPPMSRTTFYVRWHRILKSVNSGGAAGVPGQKFGLFVTAGGRTAASLSFADRLLAHSQQAFADTPKKQKNNNKRCSDLDYNQSHALISGMLSGQRSTLWNGLSGEPRF